MADAFCPVCDRVAHLPPGGAAFCPDCGFDLSVVHSVPAWVVRGVDLRRVARRQRALLWYVLALLGVNCLPAVRVPVFFPGIEWLYLLAALAVLAMVVVGVVSLLGALRVHVALQVLLGLLMIAPCINLLILLITNQMATRALRKAGLRVGFMGVRDEMVLRVLNIYRCRGCGYSLIGNVSGRCPECGAPCSIVLGPAAAQVPSASSPPPTPPLPPTT